MADSESIPIGIYAFNGDGQQLGKVTEVEPEGIVLEDDSGTQHFVPRSAVEGVSAGKLQLRGGFTP